MSYDPNWFYSSLAQCAAAVVGLMGAILATRVQHELAMVQSTYEEVVRLARRFRAELQIYIDELQKFFNFRGHLITEIEGALDRGETRIKVNGDVYINGGGSSGERTIEVNQGILEEYKKLHVSVGCAIAILRDYPNLDSIAHVRAMEPSLTRLETILSPDYPRNLIEGWCNSSRSIEKAYTTHLSAISIRIPSILTVILGWLCIFGLIVPLWYLSAHGINSKAILLGAFALGVVSIPTYIGIELIRIYRMRRVVLAEDS